MGARQSAATDRALRLMARTGISAYAAARKTGLQPSTVRRAAARIAKKSQENTVDNQQFSTSDLI
jgi:hypothetical protein